MARARLPVMGTVKTTVLLAIAQTGSLAVAVSAFLPFYFAAALVSAGTWHLLVDALALSVGLVLIAVVSVAWYRANLLGERPHLFPRLSRRHLNMSLMSLLLSALVYAPLGLAERLFLVIPEDDMRAELVAITIFAGLLLLVWYLYLRLFLVLPAISLDRAFGLKDAWRVSAGNGWRLLGVSFLIMAPLIAVLLTLDVLFDAPLDDPNLVSLAIGLNGPGLGTLEEALYVALQSMTHVVLAAFLTALGSVAFKDLTASAPSSSGSTAL